MLNKSKYWKSLLGTFADVLIAKQVDYAGTGASTAIAGTLADFVANAAEGEFAFINANTNAVISGALSGTPAVVQPVGATTWIYGAIKRDGNIETTRRFRLADYTAQRVVYAAPIKQVSTATFSGAPVAGNYYSIKIMETTPGYQPFPRWEYGYTAKTGDTLATVLTKITALVNDSTNIINKNTDPVVNTAVFNSTTMITLTATLAGPTFKIAFSIDALNDLTAVAAYTGGTTAGAFWGNGTYDQVFELERESDVYKGVTTQYPEQGARPEDFGQPSQFATSGATYNVYILTGVKTENSPTPKEMHYQPHNIILAIPSNGAANADAEVKGILGL